MITTTKCAALVLAIGGLGFGLAAAWYWRKSTKVPIDPLEGDPHAIMPVVPELEQLAWRAAEVHANQDVARLNVIAAWLTGVAVVLGFAASVAGLL
ncbi:hypothetical protein [Burkholderia stagnalis]